MLALARHVQRVHVIAQKEPQAALPHYLKAIDLKPGEQVAAFSGIASVSQQELPRDKTTREIEHGPR